MFIASSPLNHNLSIEKQIKYYTIFFLQKKTNDKHDSYNEREKKVTIRHNYLKKD